MISLIIKEDNSFETFKIICAGSDSLIIQSISDYIQNTYGLIEDENADLKIHIIKQGGIWEVGAQISPKPLSVRSYKVRDMEGAMNPTIAYAANSLCDLENTNSYLNIFSGSATLLIEAGQCYKNIKQLIGFDNNKEALSLSIKNIREAGLIKAIKVKEADIFDKPSFGMFDVITADLPFGMLVSKFENLETLYQSFIEYSRKALKDKGVLVVYTVKSDMLKKIIKQSEFKIINSLELELITSSKAFFYPSIFVCKLR
jgi:23S rRNA G2445 N2-methylase RlmL